MPAGSSGHANWRRSDSCRSPWRPATRCPGRAASPSRRSRGVGGGCTSGGCVGGGGLESEGWVGESGGGCLAVGGGGVVGGGSAVRGAGSGGGVGGGGGAGAGGGGGGGWGVGRRPGRWVSAVGVGVFVAATVVLVATQGLILSRDWLFGWLLLGLLALSLSDPVRWLRGVVVDWLP